MYIFRIIRQTPLLLWSIVAAAFIRITSLFR